MRNFNPKTVLENERLISRAQGSGFEYGFSDGMFDDLPVTPPNGVKYLENYIDKGDRLEPRGGTKVWSNTALPSLRGKSTSPDSQVAYVTTSTVSGTTRTITKSAGADFTSADIGRFFVNDSGSHEEILTVSTTAIITTRTASETEWTTTAGWVRGPVNALLYHHTEQTLVMHIDRRIFVADDINITGWTQVFCVSYDTPSDAISKFDEFNQYMFLFNSNGVFKVDVSLSSKLYWKINTPVPTTRITDSGINSNGVVTTGLVYGRRYMYTMVRLSGSGIRDRATSGVAILHETGPTLVDSAYKDYGTVYQARPFGLGATTYGVLTGAALNIAWNEVSDWTAVSDGQFTITINGTTYNVTCDFTGALSFVQIAERIQLGIRDNADFAKVTCEYDAGHFVITSPTDGGSVTVVSAGDAGTDIGTLALSCQSGAGTVTTPQYSAMSTVGTFTCSTDSGSATPQFHHTHYGVYATLDIGDNGIDPISGSGNNNERFVWLYDLPVARSFTAAEDSSNVITLGEGEVFYQSDVGCVFKYADASTSSIQYLSNALGTRVYTETSRYAVGNAGTTASQSAALGGGDVFTASQGVSGSEIVGSGTVTRTAGATFSSSDVGKMIHWKDGTCSHIVRYLTANTVEVAESTVISSGPATMDPVSRSFTDYITDFTLRSRVGGYPLRNRFWDALPFGTVGEVSNGFMFTAQQSDDKLSYSRIGTGLEHLAGYYHPAYQYATIKGDIQDIVEFPDSVIVFCSKSTHKIPTNVYSEVIVKEVGEVVSVLSGQTVVDHDIGATVGSIAKLDESRAIVVTTEPAVRVFDGFAYGDNIYQDRLMKKLYALQGAYSTAADLFNGHILYGLNE